eukprot:364963-Chlamydomonas_euryale.AAC.16
MKGAVCPGGKRRVSVEGRVNVDRRDRRVSVEGRVTVERRVSVEGRVSVESGQKGREGEALVVGGH